MKTKHILTSLRGYGASPELRQGSKGAAVRKLQEMLAAANFGVEVDGDFGPGTDNAVKTFQISRGLTPDGIVGPNTWAALAKVSGSAPPVSASIGSPVVSSDDPRIVQGIGGGAGLLTPGGSAIQSPSAALPKWVVPVAAGSVALLALLAMMGGKKKPALAGYRRKAR